MEKKQDKNESPLRGLRQAGILTGIPMVMVAGLLVGYFFGSWIDKSFNVNPWGKTLFSILGIIAGIKQTIRLIKDTTKDDE